MKFYFVSDVHSKFRHLQFLENGEIDTDFVFYVGDIINTIRDFGTFEHHLVKVLKHYRVYFIPGNHEYYLSTIEETDSLFYELSSKHYNFHYCKDVLIDFGDFKMFCSTLWSRVENAERDNLPSNVNVLHLQSLERLEWCVKHSKKPLVLCTHYPITSLANKGWANSPFYFTHYPHIFRDDKVKLMVYGHTHVNIRNFGHKLYGNCIGKIQENTKWDRKVLDLEIVDGELQVK